MRKYNGFTLVEIIVSIAIGSIVLLIAGGIILSSSNFLMTTTDMDIDKRAVDSIVDFVRGEIEYSTDVRFVEHGDKLAPDYTKDSDWHYFYIKDDELYRDGAKVFAKSFTNNKSLSISMKGNGTSTSNHRLDIKYALLDNKNEISYSSRDTVMLLNLSVSQEILKQGIYSADYKDISDNGYWLFYTKKAKDLASIPEEEIRYTGTVADQLKFLDFDNNRWEYASNTAYRYGDIVYCDNYWWMKITNNENQTEKPGQTASHWKRLTAEFTYNSYYEKGDVIIYNGEYYRRHNNSNSNETPSMNNEYMWEHISKAEAETTIYTPKPNKNKEKDDTTIVSKLSNIDINKIPDYEESKNDKYNVFEWEAPTDASDFVKKPFKIDNKEIHDNDGNVIYKYYYRIFNNDAKPGEKSSKGYVSWQEIKLDYDQNCAYSFGDKILSKSNDGDKLAYFTSCGNILTEDYLNYLIGYVNNTSYKPYDPKKLYSDYINPGSLFTKDTKYVWVKSNN